MVLSLSPDSFTAVCPLSPRFGNQTNNPSLTSEDSMNKLTGLPTLSLAYRGRLLREPRRIQRRPPLQWLPSNGSPFRRFHGC